ncbi:stage VI sporulation protein F [Paenibacillus yanchengensis]|uniref:Stage VI sporulation protein F n=1 Tax=Paenibacillus yanchengensis TaxID=2035833 RepID=A0ABW4YMD2_9BACL
MSYQNYGVSPELVARVKRKMKNPLYKDKMKKLLDGVTKADLQNRAKVRRLVKQSAAIVSEKLTDHEEQQMVAFVLAQKIDPNNTIHLLKLWSMFR